MSWLRELLKPVTSDIIDTVGDVVDELVTSDEERLAIKQRLLEIRLQHEREITEIVMRYDSEITKRWTSDAEAWLTRSTRPIIILVLTASFISIAFFSGFGWITLDPAWLPTYQQILILAYTAYFGGRSVEKIFNKNK